MSEPTPGTAPDPGADAPPGTHGRLVLVTGSDASGAALLARAVGERLGDALVVDGRALEAMLVPGRPDGPGEPGLGQLRRQLLRWSAGLALAETYLIEGHDVVVAEPVQGRHLEDYLDLAAPEPVHVVVLGTGIDPQTPAWGLWVTSPPDAADASALAGTADEVVERLAESVVLTEGTGREPVEN